MYLVIGCNSQTLYKRTETRAEAHAWINEQAVFREKYEKRKGSNRWRTNLDEPLRVERVNGCLSKAVEPSQKQIEMAFDRWFDKANVTGKIRNACEEGQTSITIYLSDDRHDRVTRGMITSPMVHQLLKQYLPGMDVVDEIVVRPWKLGTNNDVRRISINWGGRRYAN